MKTPIVILTAGTFIVAVCGQDYTTPDAHSSCKKLYTYGYGYNSLFHLGDIGAGIHNGSNSITFRFSVQASSNAHIMLGPTSTPAENLPVYEIVLGAGRNTFSDIRRLRRGGTKSTANTPDILSQDEYRAFWLRYSTRGRLEVGRENNDLPFLYWDDPNPLGVRFLSFSTWSNVVGKWLYDCSPGSDTETTVVEPDLTWTQKLRRDLLTAYDPYTRPVLNQDHLTTVSMNLAAHHIQLDEKKSTLIVHGELRMVWNDEKVCWNSSDYNGITSLNVVHHEIWQPELVLYNAVGHGADLLDSSGLIVSVDGTVAWFPQTSLKSWCVLDLSDWPRDRQTCELQLGFWSQQQFIDLQIIAKGFLPEMQRTDSEWKVVDIETKKEWIKTPWNTWTNLNQVVGSDVEADQTTALVITFTLERHRQAYIGVLVAPFIVSSFIVISSFWFAPRHSVKIRMVCLNQILLAMFLTTLGNVLPASSQQVPAILTVYCWGLLGATVSIIVSVVMIGFSQHSETYPLPQRLRIYLNTRLARAVLLLPQIKTQADDRYNQLAEPHCDESAYSATTSVCTENLQYWNLLAIAFDRILCVVYCIFFGSLLIFAIL